MPRLTKSYVQKALANPPGGDKTFWDDALKGFGLRLQGNAASWVVMYRSQGRLRKLTLAKADRMTPEEARSLAKEKLAEAAQGGEPPESPARRKVAPAPSGGPPSSGSTPSACGACAPTACAAKESKEAAPVPAAALLPAAPPVLATPRVLAAPQALAPQVTTTLPPRDSRPVLGEVSWHRGASGGYADPVSSFSRVWGAVTWAASQAKGFWRRHAPEKPAVGPLDDLDWLADQDSLDAGSRAAGKARASRK
jgi:hypothetical protein